MGDLRLQGVHLDSGDPTTYNEASATAYAAGLLGKIFSVSGNTTNVDSGLQPKTFQIVKLAATAQTSAVGQVCVWSDIDALTVNNTYTIATAANSVAGVLNNASLTAGNFVCLQIGGNGPVLMETTQTVAAGDVIVVGAATQGKGQIVAAGTAPTHIPLGVAKTAKNSGSATTVEAMLFPPRIY